MTRHGRAEDPGGHRRAAVGHGHSRARRNGSRPGPFAGGFRRAARGRAGARRRRHADRLQPGRTGRPRGRPLHASATRCCQFLGCRAPGEALGAGCVSELTRDGDSALAERQILLYDGAPAWLSAVPVGARGRVVVMLPASTGRGARARGAAAALRVRALAAGIETATGPLAGEWLGHRPGQVLKYLVCERGRVVRSRSCSRSSGRTPAAPARRNVRQAIHTLRDRLEPDRPRGKPSGSWSPAPAATSSRRPRRDRRRRLRGAARAGLEALRAATPSAPTPRWPRPPAPTAATSSPTSRTPSGRSPSASACATSPHRSCAALAGLEAGGGRRGGRRRAPAAAGRARAARPRGPARPDRADAAPRPPLRGAAALRARTAALQAHVRHRAGSRSRVDVGSAAVLAAVLALASSLSWGLSDFLGGLQSRRHRLLAVLVLSQGLRSRSSSSPCWRARRPSTTRRRPWAAGVGRSGCSASSRSTARWRSGR